MGKPDMVSFGGRVLLGAALLVGVAALLTPPADALDLPPITVPPVSVGPLETPPVEVPTVPVPSTVQIGPLVVTPPVVTTDPDGGLHVRVPLPTEVGTDPNAIGVNLGPDGANVSLPPALDLPSEPAVPPAPVVTVPAGAPETPVSRASPSSRTSAAERARAGNHDTVPTDAARADGAREIGAERPVSRIVDRAPAGASGSLAEGSRDGLRSLLASAAHNTVTWLVLIGLALVARFVATWAWRDRLRITAASPRRVRDRSGAA